MVRWVLVVLALASVAQADASVPEEAELPATDGTRLLLDDGVSATGRVRYVDLARGHVGEMAVGPGMSGFVPLRKVVMVDRENEPRLEVVVNGLAVRFDERIGRMTISGRIRRSLDLNLRDTCQGARRVRVPNDLTIWVGETTDVVLIESSSNAGYCQCEDWTEQRVVTRRRVVKLID